MAALVLDFQRWRGSRARVRWPQTAARRRLSGSGISFINSVSSRRRRFWTRSTSSFAGFADYDFFAVDEREQGIGRGLGPLDQVAVDVERIAVEPGEFNHGAASDGVCLLYRRKRGNDEGDRRRLPRRTEELMRGGLKNSEVEPGQWNQVLRGRRSGDA